MYPIQKIIQTICILGFVAALVLALFHEESGFIGRFIIYSFLWMLPVGATQILGSLVNVIEKGKKSPFRLHFLLSIIFLSVLFSLLVLSESIYMKILHDLIVISLVACAGLMFYYWYLIFKPKGKKSTS